MPSLGFEQLPTTWVRQSIAESGFCRRGDCTHLDRKVNITLYNLDHFRTTILWLVPIVLPRDNDRCFWIRAGDSIFLETR
jgi:hypothetical protein